MSAEYGPASGTSLDPDGGLQTTLLPPVLADQIAPLATLGVTAAYFPDESTKLIYVVPKTRGFTGGISHAPWVKNTDGGVRNLTQTGLTWEHYWASHVLRVGGTYAYAMERVAPGTEFHDTHSWSFGASATIEDALTVGASYTSSSAPRGGAQGYAASVNYNRGAWTVGAFVQRSEREDQPALAGNDRLSAAQAGISYRMNTRIRHFAAVYRYHLVDESGAGRLGDNHGTSWIIGTRISI